MCLSSFAARASRLYVAIKALTEHVACNDDDDNSDDGEDKQHTITSEYHLMAMVIVCSCG